MTSQEKLDLLAANNLSAYFMTDAGNKNVTGSNDFRIYAVIIAENDPGIGYREVYECTDDNYGARLEEALDKTIDELDLI